MRSSLLLVLVPLIVLSSILTHDAPAETPQWHWLNPKPTGTNLNDVVYPDASTAFAVGDAGIILCSTDGGHYWEALASLTAEPFTAISFADPLTGVAVGLNGTIIRTTDGGSSWSLQNIGVTADLNGVCFTDPLTGTVVGAGGTILRTTDGGSSWTPQTSGTGVILWDVDFVDSFTGTICGDDGTVIRTDDGGATWIPQTIETTRDLFGIALIDSLTGIVVGTSGNNIFGTTDGGVTWSPRMSGWGDWHLRAVHFVNSLMGAAVGTGTFDEWPGIVLITTDGGFTWTKKGFYEYLAGIAFGDTTTATVVGTQGFIYQTTDEGVTWGERRSQFFGQPRGVFFTNTLIGFVVGNTGNFHRTTDGGRTWEVAYTGTSADLRDVDFAELTGFAVGQSVLLVTHDNGLRWSVTEPGPQNISAVDFVNSMTGWIVGDDGASEDGVILRTNDQGATWTELRRGGPAFDDVSFVNETLGWVVGGNLILKTSDGGNSWDSINPHQDVDLTGVFFANEMQGAAVGFEGTVLTTNNGGDTWERPSSGTTQHLLDVSFVNGQMGIAVGGGGTILLTVDGGVTWIKQYSATMEDLYGVDATGRIVGDISQVRSVIPIPDPGTLPSIASFNATTGLDYVELTWTVGTEDFIDGFRLLRQSTGLADVWASADTLIGPHATTFLDRGLDPGRGYAYTLFVVYSTGAFVASTPLNATTRSLPVVTEFRATAAPEQVQLAWLVDSVDFIDGFRLLRQSTGLADVWLPTDTLLGALTITFTDEGPESGREYGYTLVAYIINGMEVNEGPLYVTAARPPTITLFAGTPANRRVELTWSIDSNEFVRGFRVLRELDDDDVWLPTDGLLPPSARNLSDASVEGGLEYAYTLITQLTPSGEVRAGPVLVTTESDTLPPDPPETYALGQNHPNPFNPVTLIPYDLPERTWVSLCVFDTSGRLVRTVVDGYRNAGRRSEEWNGLNDAGAAVPSGVYFYRMTTAGNTFTRKMVLVR